MRSGNRPDAFQSNVPPSTIAPPIVVPWPPMNFVAECTTMSAPYSIGRSSTGVGSVLSTISGTPASCATFAIASTSSTSTFGLPSDSANTAFVFGRIAAATACGSEASTSDTAIPNRGSVWTNALYVPP